MAMMAIGLAGAGGGLGGAGLLRLGIMGASIAGSMMGGGQQEKNSTKLNDLKVSSSSYGKGIPLVYGTMRVTGNMFWATDFEEERTITKKGGKKTKSGDKKKGGKKGQENYEYFANFAMGLCTGEVKEVLKIWADSNLIYDKYGTDEDDVVGPGFSTQENGGSDKKGGKGGKGKGATGGDSGRFRFRFYTGSEEQRKDNFMVSTQGTENVPAFKGLCYLMFEHLSVTDFGNRTPTITAEVSVDTRRGVTANQFQPLEFLNDDTAAGLGIPDLSYPTVQIGTKRFINHRDKELLSYDISPSSIRFFDLNTLEETRRIAKSELKSGQITRFGVTNPIWEWHDAADNGAFLGVSAIGDLIYKVNQGNNSNPIIIYDSKTLYPLVKWGSADNSTGVSLTNMFQPSKVLYYTYPDLLTGTPFWQTVLTNARADIVIFNERYQAVGAVECPFSAIFSGAEALISPVQNPNGFKYLLLTDSSIVDGYSLYSFVDDEVSFYMTGLGVGTDLNPAQSDYDLFYERELRYDLGESTITSVSVFEVTGANCYGIIETVEGPAEEMEGTFAVKLDKESGRFVWRARVSSSSSAVADCEFPPAVSGNIFSFMFADDVYNIDFAQEDVTRFNYPSGAPPQSGFQTYYSLEGGIITNVEGSVYTDLSMLYVDRKQRFPADLHGILYDICERIGFERSQIDVTDVANDEIAGYILESPVEARSVIDQLSDLYFFDVIESDYKIKFVSRQKDVPLVPDWSIVQDKLGVVEEVGGGYEVLKETRLQEIDLPYKVDFTFIDPKNDYETNSTYVSRPKKPVKTANTRNKLDVNIPMAMTVNEAKTFAHRLLYGAWTERVSYDMKLSWEFLALDPTDVIEVTMDDGYVFNTRIAQADFGVNYELDLVGFSYNNGTYSAVKTGAEAGNIITRPKVYSPSVKAIALDIPYAVDGDAESLFKPELYTGMGAYGDGFRGGTVFTQGADNVTKYDDNFIDDLVWGRIAAIVPAHPAGHCDITDETTELIVIPAYDFESVTDMYTWSSIDPTLWPNESNIICVGKEIIKFRDVLDNADGTYTLTHLIRGDRGTESEHDKHQATEEFFIINEYFKDDARAVTDIGSPLVYAGMTPDILSVRYATEVTLEGRSMYPWAPSAVLRSDSAGDTTITWSRRPRIGGQWQDGTGTVPTVEDAIEYQLFLLAAPYDVDTFDPGDATTYLRSYTELASATVTYTAAEKATDSVAALDPIHYVVYQVSGYIGRGFPGTGTLNYYAV